MQNDVKQLLQQKVFFFHSQRGWELGVAQTANQVENRAGILQTVVAVRSAEDDQLVEVVYKGSLIVRCSPGVDTMSPDNLLTLPELHNAILVNCLRQRHSKDVVYTGLGELIVALNPFKFSIPWYQDEMMVKYLAHLDSPELPPEVRPHTWAVAHRAYVSMRRFGANHSIIISGESGSGKTESCKTMLRYLCAASESSSRSPAVHRAVHRINERVQLSNVILEAFGNAKTLRNDNSSRFGKFTEVQFNTQGVLVGMRTTPFLLERSRVVHCGQDERVFHCFYQLAAGAPKELQNELQVRNAKDFVLLTQGKCVSLKSSGVDDAVGFQQVTQAMTTLQFSETEQRTVWRVVAAVAHLQNIQFCDRFGKKGGDEAELDGPSADIAHFVAKDLLMLPEPQTLQRALVTSTAVVKGEVVERKLSVQKAADQRDGICKLLYSKLFLWIVDKINSATSFGAEGVFAADASGDAATSEEEKSELAAIAQESPSSWVALLDIFGFEDFPNNSFEQFCINLANESLQRHYTRHHFIRDMEEMKNEGISTQAVKFIDNMPCVELLQGAKNSVISVLDDCSTLDLERAQTNPNLTFLSKLTQLHRPDYQTVGNKSGKSILDRHGPTAVDAAAVFDKPSDYFHRGRLDDDTFTVRHYAGDIKYKVLGFIEKNMDSVKESSLQALVSTASTLLRGILEMDDNIGLLADAAALGGIGSPHSPRGNSFAASPGSPRSRAGAPASLAKRTVASQFRTSLRTLMDTLDQSSPHWVRCIRPHSRKAPNLFDGKLVLEQLVATGVLATIEQRQRNFPFRIPHADFIQRYSVLAAGTLRRLGGRTTTSEKCSVIVASMSQDRSKQVSEADVQVGRGRVFLSAAVMALLESGRASILDRHVAVVSMFARCYFARKQCCLIIWTFHAVRCQRIARRSMRIRRAVAGYYNELCQRIRDRHVQEQRDTMHAEAKHRPRIVMEELAEFSDTAAVFRRLLGPMITTVLKNVRSVEADQREILLAELQTSFWVLEAAFAEGAQQAHERRKQRLAEEHRSREAARQRLVEDAVSLRGAIAQQELRDRLTMQQELLPMMCELHAAARRIAQQQAERDHELRRLARLRDAELRRIGREDARRRAQEEELWRATIGEEAFLQDVAAWRHAPDARRAFMRQFCATRTPSKVMQMHPHVTCMRDVAQVFQDAYQTDLQQRLHTAQHVRSSGAGAPAVSPERAFRQVVVGETVPQHAALELWSAVTLPTVSAPVHPSTPAKLRRAETQATGARDSVRRRRSSIAADSEDEWSALALPSRRAADDSSSDDEGEVLREIAASRRRRLDNSV